MACPKIGQKPSGVISTSDLLLRELMLAIYLQKNLLVVKVRNCNRYCQCAMRPRGASRQGTQARLSLRVDQRLSACHHSEPLLRTLTPGP